MTTPDTTEAQILIDWFADGAGFSMGTKAPHKWVLQAESELRRLAAEIGQGEDQARCNDPQRIEPPQERNNDGGEAVAG